MPSKTPDQLKARTARLRTKLAEKKDKLSVVQVRKAKKTIRRVQRRRRNLVATAAKRAGIGKEKAES